MLAGASCVSERPRSSIRSIHSPFGAGSMCQRNSRPTRASISGAMLGNFYSTGQVCSNGTRVFVPQSMHDRFVDRLVERTKKIRIGDPLDPETQMGPLINKAQHE